jgi:hypothetical protein
MSPSWLKTMNPVTWCFNVTLPSANVTPADETPLAAGSR